MMGLRRLSLALLLGPCLGGCGDDPAGQLFKAEGIVTLTTELSEAEVEAGTSVTVTCRAVYENGVTKDLVPPEVTIQVAPEASVEAAEVTATAVGRHEVQCRVGNVDGTTAHLEVIPGPVTRLVASVEPATIASSEESVVACSATDAFGNEVAADATVETTPSEGVSITARTITGISAGDYQVTCSVGGDEERVPANLTVVPGAPVQLVALVTPTTAEAGTEVSVSCELADAAGNPVRGTSATFEVTPSVSATNSSGFTPTVVGIYSVVCSGEGLTSTPVEVTVTPGPAATIEILDVDPALPFYAIGQVVELTAQVTDAFGNEVAGDWSLQSDPAAATRSAGLHQLELTAHGAVELIAALVADASIEDRVTLIVDADLPQVVITTPERAEIIQGTPGQPITVSGQVTDPTSGIASFTIDGNAVAVASDGSFSTTIPSGWGINIFEGIAIDEAGNERMFAQSFELASSYRRARNTRIVSGRIDDGLMVRLSQAALDDNNPSADDLATIARLAIQQADLTALIPDPVTTFNSDCSIPFVSITGALRLHVDDVTFGTPDVDITAINGGLNLRVEIPNLVVDMHTSGDVCDIGVGVSGTASANTAVIQGNLNVSNVNGNLVVTMPNASVSLTGFGINMNLPSVIDWAVDGIISLFSNSIRNRVQDALSDVIRNEVPPVVDDFLSSLTFGTSIQLPSPISLSLGINTRLGSAFFAPGGGNLGFDTTVYTSGSITPEPLGGILQESVTAPALAGRGELVVGLAYDLLNQAMYSIWYGGGLSLDISDFAGSGGQVQGITASANAMLPPVISPSGGVSYPVELAIGDLALALDLQGVQGLPPIAATIYASARANARVTVNASGELEFELAPNPDVVLDFATPLDSSIDLPMLVAELETLLETLLPELFNEGIRGVPIPTLDLSSLAGNGLPSGIELGLGSPQVEVQSSYLVLGGNIVALP